MNSEFDYNDFLAECDDEHPEHEERCRRNAFQQGRRDYVNQSNASEYTGEHKEDYEAGYRTAMLDANLGSTSHWRKT